MEEQRYAYVGVCRKCGALCCASVDTPERTKENARYTSQWIRQGMTVERDRRRGTRPPCRLQM